MDITPARGFGDFAKCFFVQGESLKFEVRSTDFDRDRLGQQLFLLQGGRDLDLVFSRTIRLEARLVVACRTGDRG